MARAWSYITPSRKPGIRTSIIGNLLDKVKCILCLLCFLGGIALLPPGDSIGSADDAVDFDEAVLLEGFGDEFRAA
jgi:hypothetical protein